MAYLTKDIGTGYACKSRGCVAVGNTSKFFSFFFILQFCWFARPSQELHSNAIPDSGHGGGHVAYGVGAACVCDSCAHV